MSASTFRVERTTVIDAPAERIHAHINDFHEWTKWSPWEGIDPAMERSYSGMPSGVGAQYGWKGNRKAGQGSMEIVSSTPGSEVGLRLSFVKPIKAENQTTFLLAREGDATRVTWAMTGKKNLLSKIMGVFFPMDKLVGKDFEKGLVKLKTISETEGLTVESCWTGPPAK
jgi:Polyketide cyclase / dehydrase and lipid transport